MNSKNLIDLNKNPNNNLVSEQKSQNVNYINLFPCISEPKQNQQNQEKIQYFPITTKESFTGQNIIYLAAEDNHNINKTAQNCDYNNSEKKENKPLKNNNNNNILVPQRSIEFQFQNEKFEYLINSPVKNEKESNINKDNNNKNNLDNLDNNSIKKEKSDEEDSKNNNKNKESKNKKDNFVSTIKNIFDKHKNSRNKGLVKSYSVDNYPQNLLNRALSNFNAKLEKLENSDIMKKKFLLTLKDSKRKDNLLKAIEKYKRFKSLGKINITDSLNNSFTNGIEQNKKRQKSIERIYRMNNYNIIFEDENENSDFDTIQKAESKKNEKIENDKNNYEESDNKNKKSENMIYKEVKENIKENMEEIEMKNKENDKKIQKIKTLEKMKKFKIKNKKYKN